MYIKIIINKLALTYVALTICLLEPGHSPAAHIQRYNMTDLLYNWSMFFDNNSLTKSK